MRTQAIAAAHAHYDSGAFQETMSRLIARRTESTVRGAPLRPYLTEVLTPRLESLGFTARMVENPVAPQAPFLIAERHEDAKRPTILSYGHGDVVRGDDAHWRQGLSPWELTLDGDRWYGRGSADNKGQHTINLAALEAVLATRRGQLGFNMKFIFEMGEEIGSPGLHAVCRAERAALSADLLIASDGPRVSAGRPTVFLGARGLFQFELHVNLRDGGHHSGNWGGVLRNPAVVLSHAIASLIDANGRILVEGLRPPPVDAAVRAALADIEVGQDAGSPVIDADWGEPGLTPSEKLLGWNALEVLAMTSGNPEKPVNAVPPTAFAVCQLRHVVGTDETNLKVAVEQHLRLHGFGFIEVRAKANAPATRLDPRNPWVGFVLDSIKSSCGLTPALLPNFGGTLPNDAFAVDLGLPTIWIPHSYPACSQHAPNEHLLGSVARKALGLMAGLFMDIGERGPEILAQCRR